MTLVRDLLEPVPEPIFPKEFALINVTERCPHLWEQFMDECFGAYQPGSFRWVFVGNYNYAEDRVFILLNEQNQPIGTGSSWPWWEAQAYGYINFIGVSKGYRRLQLGYTLTNYCLYDMKRCGYKAAVIHTDKDNHPALKTYLKCGFVPLPRSEEDIQHWAEACDAMQISLPDYDKTIRTEKHTEHPPRPWPYQLAREKAASANGDLFIHGSWNQFNMYEIDKVEYVKLKTLISDDEAAQGWLHTLQSDENGKVFVDSDVNPRAALFVDPENVSYQFGESWDGCFEDGIVLFFAGLKFEKTADGLMQARSTIGPVCGVISNWKDFVARAVRA